MRQIVHRCVDATHKDYWELTRTPRAYPHRAKPRAGHHSSWGRRHLVHFNYIAREYGIIPPTRKMGPKAALAHFDELLSVAKRAA